MELSSAGGSGVRGRGLPGVGCRHTQRAELLVQPAAARSFHLLASPRVAPFPFSCSLQSPAIPMHRGVSGRAHCAMPRECSACAVYVHCACLMHACASAANCAADLVGSVARVAEAAEVVAREGRKPFRRFDMGPRGDCSAAAACFLGARRAICASRLVSFRAPTFALSSSSPSSVVAL